MATDAQKLIGISLTKIAQSRVNRGGICLHRNLLVATVLQKARFIFMEEAYGGASLSSNHNQLSVPHVEPHKQVQERLQPETITEENSSQETLNRVHKRRRESDGEEKAAKRCCGMEQQADVCPAAGEERLRPTYESDSDRTQSYGNEEPMEVDRITSLVSVFSFGAHSAVQQVALPMLGRTVSTPEFCSAQAKELEGIHQRSALAMTV